MPKCSYTVRKFGRREFCSVRIHIVQKGDTLDKIAEKYDVPVQELRRANPGFSKTDVIERGKRLKSRSRCLE